MILSEIQKSSKSDKNCVVTFRTSSENKEWLRYNNISLHLVVEKLKTGWLE